MHMEGSERTGENCFSPFTTRAPDNAGLWAWCVAPLPTMPSWGFLIIYNKLFINKLVSNDIIAHFPR